MAGDRNNQETRGDQLATGEKSFMGRKGVEELTEELRREESGEVERSQHLKPFSEDQEGKPLTPDDFEGLPSGEEIMHDIDLLGVRMGLFSHGVDFLIDNGFPGEVWRGYEEMRVEALAKLAARVMGLKDHEPLIKAETRTPEQQEVMLQLSGREQMARLNAYQRSGYFAALGIVIDAMAEALHVDGKALSGLPEWEDISDACAYLNRYYFAIHKEINPAGDAEELPEEAREEIREIVLRVVAYRNEHGGGYFESIAPSLRLTAAGADRLSEITQQGYFDLPISKAWRAQPDIAQEGAAGRELNVGKKTSSGAVIISAAISGKNGEPLAITELEKGVQRAIGNLIAEAGGILPITVSPQQIYRAFARLSPEATVTQQQSEEIERIMDALMYAESSLDFKAQLEKHKRIKQQPDYDYQSERSGKLSGPLVPAQKLEGATARDGSRVVAYKVLAWPVFYQYSHIIGQMARIPNNLLTGSEKKPTKENGRAEAQGTARNIAIRQNILTRIERMIERREKHLTYIALIKVDEVADDCGVTLTKKTRRTMRKNMELFLDELKQQEKIRGFTETKEGREIAGFTIQL